MTLGLGMDRLGLCWPGLHTWNIPLVAICQPEAKASFCSCQLLTVGDGSAGSTRPLLQDRHASAGAGHLDMAGPVACTPLPSIPAHPASLIARARCHCCPCCAQTKAAAARDKKTVHTHRCAPRRLLASWRLHTRSRSARGSFRAQWPAATPRPASGARVRHMTGAQLSFKDPKGARALAPRFWGKATPANGTLAAAFFPRENKGRLD